MPLTDYAGARGRTDLRAASRQTAQHALQPKIDGAYAQLHLDAAGRVARVLARSGEQWPASLTADLMGARIGAPHAVLAGELECHTEQGNRLAQIRGARGVWLFDAIRGDGGRYLGRLPYRQRRDALWRMLSDATESPERPYVRDRHGAAHDRASGRYARPTLADGELATIVPQLAATQLDSAWRQWVDLAGHEGLVCVALDAPLGARGGKRKIKRTDTHDCTVVDLDARAVRVLWPGARITFVTARPKFQLAMGDTVAVACEGYYDSGAPKFARIVALRSDLGRASLPLP